MVVLGVQSARLRSRGVRRPLRPPWRNRFSLGRESFGGRSFRFFTPTELRPSRKHLWPIPFRVCSIMSSRRLCFAVMTGRARFLIKNDGIPSALQERASQSNANRSDLSVAGGAVRTKPSPALAIKIRFGRTLWKSLHGLADGWPCARCRPQMIDWMQGLHDAVNVRLGKPPFRPDSYARYASGLLERGFHSGCFGCRVARAGSRFLARAPRPPIWSR